MSDCPLSCSCKVRHTAVPNCSCAHLQITTVGTPSLDFLPGVLAPQVVKAGAASRAGVLPGDIILGINGEALAPSAASVRRVVDVIRRAVAPGVVVCHMLQRFEGVKSFLS